MFRVRVITGIFIFICSIGNAWTETSPAGLDQTQIDVDIVSQPLEDALVALSIQADVNIIGRTESLKALQSTPLNGSMTLREALEKLLQGTGLDYKYLGGRSISFFPKPPEDKPETSPQDTSPLLEEVIVSATRRSANLQDTPIAVSSADSEVLDRNQVRDLRDVSSIVPGLEFINTSPQAAVLVQLRGVGTTNITEIADGPVSIHVDGVYAPRSQSVAALLYDVDRVEVLRGPQGTLFGRNSSSGSINIFLNEPQLERSTGELYASFGNFDQQVLRGAINIPLSDTFAVRVASALNKRDAYTKLLDNYAGLAPHYPATEEELGDFDRSLDFGQKGPETADQSGWRISGLWQPTEDFNVVISGERYRDQGTGIAELDPTLVDRGIRGVVLDSPSFLNLRSDTLRSRVNYRFPSDLSLTYTFGYSNMLRQQIFDADNGRDGAFEQQRTDSSEFQFYSHELQLLNSESARLRWVLGLFSSDERNDIVFAIDQQNASDIRGPEGASSWISDDPGAAVSYAVQPDRRVESLGIYAQGTYDINASSKLTLGARFTRDTKSDIGGRTINCRVTSVLGPYVESGSVGPGAPTPEQIYADPQTTQAIEAGLPYDLGTDEGIGSEPCWIRQVNDFSATWENTSGLLRYELSPQEDLLLYTSVSTGFKSGHIQDAGNNADPETVLNYELGVKAELLEKSLRINSALYKAEYDDLQFSNQDRLDINGDGIADTGGSTVIRNASAATIQGLEVEVNWTPVSTDTLQITGTLMDAEFKRFEIPDSIFGNLFNPYVSASANSPLDPVDLSGNAPPRTPDWKLHISYEHRFHLANSILAPRFVATLSDDYFLDIYNRDRLDAGIFDHLPNGGSNLGVQKSYQTYDASLRFEPNSENWLVEFYIKNLTNENVKLSAGNFITEQGFVATYLPPRSYGINFSRSF